MNENKPGIDTGWSDPDDAPEFTDEMFDAAEFSIGGKVIRQGAWRSGETSKEYGRFTSRIIVGGARAMATGKKTTSPTAAKAASKTLQDGRTAKNSKTAAGSALSQREKPKGGKSK